MGKGYKHGGSGGTSLNFNVKTYPSETELKAAKPSLNTIGVITTTTLTSWAFLAKETTEPEVGMMWLSVGNSSSVEFNALKNNTLQVYPISAKQYEGGKWVDKVAYSYQNGEWVSWCFYLFSANNGINKGSWNKNVSSTGSFSVTDSKIDLTNSSNNGTNPVCVTNSEPIDVTGKTKLTVVMTSSNVMDVASGFGLTDDPNNTTAKTAIVSAKLGNGTIELELPDSGVYYFKVWLFMSDSASSAATCSITEIKTH